MHWKQYSALRTDAGDCAREAASPFPGKGMIGALLIGSAAIASAMVCLPLPSASSVMIHAAPSHYSSHFSEMQTSNSALKGDRLRPAKPPDASFGVEPKRFESPSAVHSGRKIPIG